MSFFPAFVLSLCAGGMLGASEARIRFIDGIPFGGPPLTASAMEWAVNHYRGERANDSVFAAGAAKRLEYVVNLVGVGRPVTWVDVHRIEVSGRVPARVLVLSDGAPDRRAARVEVVYQDGDQAVGAASFSLGLTLSGKSFERRGRVDVDPIIVLHMGAIERFASRIDASALMRRRGETMELLDNPWRVYVSGRPEPAIVAGQVRSQRLLEAVAKQLSSSDALWACAVVCGFPGEPGQATTTFIPNRWSTVRGERLLLTEVFHGRAEDVVRVAIATLEERQGQLVRRHMTLEWSGASWQPSLESRAEEAFTLHGLESP